MFVAIHLYGKNVIANLRQGGSCPDPIGLGMNLRWVIEIEGAVGRVPSPIPIKPLLLP